MRFSLPLSAAALAALCLASPLASTEKDTAGRLSDQIGSRESTSNGAGIPIVNLQHVVFNNVSSSALDEEAKFIWPWRIYKGGLLGPKGKKKNYKCKGKAITGAGRNRKVKCKARVNNLKEWTGDWDTASVERLECKIKNGARKGEKKKCKEPDGPHCRQVFAECVAWSLMSMGNGKPVDLGKNPELLNPYPDVDLPQPAAPMPIAPPHALASGQSQVPTPLYGPIETPKGGVRKYPPPPAVESLGPPQPVPPFNPSQKGQPGYPTRTPKNYPTPPPPPGFPSQPPPNFDPNEVEWQRHTQLPEFSNKGGPRNPERENFAEQANNDAENEIRERDNTEMSSESSYVRTAADIMDFAEPMGSDETDDSDDEADELDVPYEDTEGTIDGFWFPAGVLSP